MNVRQCTQDERVHEKLELPGSVLGFIIMVKDLSDNLFPTFIKLSLSRFLGQGHNTYPHLLTYIVSQQTLTYNPYQTK